MLLRGQHTRAFQTVGAKLPCSQWRDARLYGRHEDPRGLAGRDQEPSAAVRDALAGDQTAARLCELVAGELG